MKVGDLVRKVGGDYEFDGFIVAEFAKLSGQRRVVVENPDGVLHIFSEKNLVIRPGAMKIGIECLVCGTQHSIASDLFHGQAFCPGKCEELTNHIEVKSCE